jgi:Polyketide cyclase / dehydrase and lipid transport
MQTENRITIEAPWRTVFKAAAEVEHWPTILKHYRWVEAGPFKGQEREVRMSASRDGIPCWWTAKQRLEPSRKRIIYLHTRSTFTRGMDVLWMLKPLGRSRTEVLLTHAMPAEGPFMAWFRQHIVGTFFVHAIAAKTLVGIKARLEDPS